MNYSLNRIDRPRTGAVPQPLGLASPVESGVKSHGRPLDDSVRPDFEQRFNHDFSRVRIHADSEAAASAASLNARAYTLGSDLVFGRGQYDPGARSGNQLLAHELAHVVQQSRGGGAPAPLADSPLERSAESAASTFMLGAQAVNVSGAAGPGLARVVAPTSLNQRLYPSSMSEEAINREIELITRWLKDNPTSAEAGGLAANLASLKEELGRRPAKQSGGVAGHGAAASSGGASAELRFPIPLVKEPAPPVVPKPSTPEANTINPSPPATKSPNIESLLPAPREERPGPLDRTLMGLGESPPAKAPAKAATKTTTTSPESPQPEPTQTSKPKEEDEKPGVGLQAGAGEQTNLRAPHGAFQYFQVSAEFSNAYVLSLKDDKLPTFLKGTLESISFLGEPGWTLQYHAVGDQTGTLDLQFLFKLIQLSLKKVDISLVGGEQFADLGKKWDSSRFTPLLGLESETEIVKAGPVKLTWVVDGLAALPQKQSPPNKLGETEPRPGRWLDGQFSGELRLKFLWDIGLGKSSEKKK